MIFTTNDKSKIVLLSVMVFALISFVFWQWLDFFPLQRIKRVDSQSSDWQNISESVSVVTSGIKDSLNRGQIKLAILEDEFQRQARQDAVVSAFKDRLQNATTTEHICNQESDCAEGSACVVELTDDQSQLWKDGDSLTHFDKPTFCESYDNLLGCFFYAVEYGEIIEICAD